MATETQSELQEFHEFLSGQLQSGPSFLSPEQAVAKWREQQETLASIQRGLADSDAGRMKEAGEVLKTLGNR